MSASASKKKRPAPSQTSATASRSTTINGILDSYDFLAPNEYSEKTIGIQAFLLRKSVGDINFSDVIDDSEKRNRHGQANDLVGILEDKRHSLPEIDASVEKCLMLDRLIAYIRDNDNKFTTLLSNVRLEIQDNMTDSQNNQTTIDFRQREQDFELRRTAQELRRLFYHSNEELKFPKNLVYLQNRTTEQLTYLVNQISRDSKNRSVYNKELEKLLQGSFMIVAQPHSGVNPVTIYERKGPGEYTAKISVIIISLLYDFMQTNSNLIELYDIEPSLCPSSEAYKLEEPRSLPWKTCQVQVNSSGKTRTFLYAEISNITIEQSSKTDTRVRFAQLLHSFKFAIKLQFNLAENSKVPIYQFALESLQFGIGAHNNQIPQLLTRVLLDDIRRFSRIQPVDVQTVQNYLRRYFIHRTGVEPSECVKINLEQELIKAQNLRSSFKVLEDIYLDILVNFVYQVEFMAKHPILAMFHADNLFLSICNSERAAEAIVQLSSPGAPVIGLRFNAIRIDYNTISGAGASSRAVKLAPCAVRVDIYNDRTKRIQNRTFDSSILASDISKFVSSAETESAGRIRILSHFDDRVNGKNFIPFTVFSKYYHPRLQEISRSDEKYKPVTDLVDNANDGNTDEDVLDNTQSLNIFSPFSPNSIGSVPPVTPSLFDPEHNSETNSNHEYMSIPYESAPRSVASPRNVLSPQSEPPQQLPYVNNQEALLKYVLSQPNLAEQVVRQFGGGIYNAPSPMESPQQVVQQPQVQYVTQPVPYHQQIPMQVLQQRQSPQMQFQQPPPQPMYHQQPTQIYQSVPMQFQQTVPQQQYFQQPQQQIFYQAQPQQRTNSPSVIHYLPTNTNQPTSFPQQTQQFSPFQNNSNDNIPPQLLGQMAEWNISNQNVNQTHTNSVPSQTITTNRNVNQTITNSVPPQTTITDQDPISLFDPAFEQLLQELENDTPENITN